MEALRLETTAVIMQELCLTFSDAMEVYLPLDILRRSCPCAACQGEPDALGRVARPRVDWTEQSYQLRKIVPVGSYALQLYWADGHSTGIYSLDYLRKLYLQS